MLIDLDAPATQEAVGEIVGVSQQAISALVAGGFIPAGLSTGQMIQAYCQRLRDQAAGRLGSSPDGLDPVQENAALKRAQREGVEIKNAVMRGEFAAIKLLAATLADASQAVAERFEQLPGQLRKACPELPPAAVDQVVSVIASARNEWVRATTELVTNRLEEQGDDFADFVPDGDGA